MDKLNLLFESFPTLKSKRCTYREISIDHAEDILAIRGDVELMYYVPREPMKDVSEVPKFIQDTADFRARLDGTLWGMFLNDSTRLIGLVGIYHVEAHNQRAEVGYILHRDFHNQGLVTEAVETVVDFAFNTLEFHSLAAVIDTSNIASERVLIKTGWTKEAHFRECAVAHGAYVDLATYSKLNPKH